MMLILYNLKNDNFCPKICSLISIKSDSKQLENKAFREKISILEMPRKFPKLMSHQFWLKMSVIQRVERKHV